MTKFVVELIDPQTGCVADEQVLETEEVERLRTVLGLEMPLQHFRGSVDLDAEQLKAVEAMFGVSIRQSDDAARLRGWRPTDELGYQVHTNRELSLMLAGTKPLAVFSESLPNPGIELIPERRFDPYVHAGRFIKQEHVSVLADLRTRSVLYALPREAWRIPAYLLLKSTAEKVGWNESFERMEGSLLGYQDWQNDQYIERIFRRG
jgi:hypothetical protein